MRLLGNAPDNRPVSHTAPICAFVIGHFRFLSIHAPTASHTMPSVRVTYKIVMKVQPDTSIQPKHQPKNRHIERNSDNGWGP